MRTTLQFNKTYVHLHSLQRTNGDHLLVIYHKNRTIGSCVVKAESLSLFKLTTEAWQVLLKNENIYPKAVIAAKKDILQGCN